MSDHALEDILDSESEVETEVEIEPEPAHEIPLPCGHSATTYAENGLDYCGVCGAIVE